MCELISLMLSGTAWVPEDVHRRPSPNEAQLGRDTLLQPDIRQVDKHLSDRAT